MHFFTISTVSFFHENIFQILDISPVGKKINLEGDVVWLVKKKKKKKEIARICRISQMELRLMPDPQRSKCRPAESGDEV